VLRSTEKHSRHVDVCDTVDWHIILCVTSNCSVTVMESMQYLKFTGPLKQMIKKTGRCI
jgi:hypothetical protein